MPKTIIVIAGPTAAGKTRAAIDLAKQFQTEIISADSRQCYRELKIGVARPSDDELNQVPHYFIASHSIHENITAAYFEQYALNKADELFRQHDVVIMVGGTGLYIRAFTEGLDKIPEIDKFVRGRIITNYDESGIAWLREELLHKDPEYSRLGEMKNPQRMMRALEVIESTGRSIISFRNTEKAARSFNIIKIGLELPKEELFKNIIARVDRMFAEGLTEEVRELIPFRNLNALQTVGYTETFDFLDGKISLDEAIQKIKTNTRQYAKRQMTWFKKDRDINWVLTDGVREKVQTLLTIGGQFSPR